MTRVYFVRHAQPEHDWEDDRTRPLTEEGKKDSAIVLGYGIASSVIYGVIYFILQSMGVN